MNGVAAVAIAMTVGGCAEIAVKNLEHTQPTGSEFNKALAGEYLAFAKNELNVQIDEKDAHHFAKKGQAAAAGADGQQGAVGKIVRLPQKVSLSPSFFKGSYSGHWSSVVNKPLPEWRRHGFQRINPSPLLSQSDL